MSSINVSAVIFACAFGGAVIGMLLRPRLPQGHLRQESKEVIMLGTGLIATMAALVLGLLIGAATTAFAAQKSGLEQLATNVVVLDRVLEHYGPQASPARELLRQTVASMIERLWPGGGARGSGMDDATITAGGGKLLDAIRNLTPSDDAQRTLQSQALTISSDLAKTRWLMSLSDDGTLGTAFLLVLAFWLFVLFASFGLFAPRNATVIGVLLLCALSVGGAIFLILDLDQPFDGLVKVSDAPLRGALEQLGQ